MPKVSIIIPNYNHADFIADRIESVLNQTFKDFEVILLDDASTDNSNNIISNYLFDSRIFYFQNKINSGSPFIQWLKGISKSRGKFIWIAESDDMADPLFLETLIKMLESSESYSLAYCQSYTIDRYNNIVGSLLTYTSDFKSYRWNSDFVNSGLIENKNYLIIKNTIPNASAVVFRKSAIENINLPTEFKLCGDWLFWSRILFKGNVVYSSKFLNYYRKHSNTVRANSSIELESSEYLKVTKEIFLKSTFSSIEKKRVCTTLRKFWVRKFYSINFNSIYSLAFFLFKFSLIDGIIFTIAIFKRKLLNAYNYFKIL